MLMHAVVSYTKQFSSQISCLHGAILSWSDSPHSALLFSERFYMEAFPPWSSILLSEVLPGGLPLHEAYYL
jgi:hypothetical protein